MNRSTFLKRLLLGLAGAAIAPKLLEARHGSKPLQPKLISTPATYELPDMRYVGIGKWRDGKVTAWPEKGDLFVIHQDGKEDMLFTYTGDRWVQYTTVLTKPLGFTEVP